MGGWNSIFFLSVPRATGPPVENALKNILSNSKMFHKKKGEREIRPPLVFERVEKRIKLATLCLSNNNNTKFDKENCQKKKEKPSRKFGKTFRKKNKTKEDYESATEFRGGSDLNHRRRMQGLSSSPFVPTHHHHHTEQQQQHRERSGIETLVIILITIVVVLSLSIYPHSGKKNNFFIHLETSIK